MSEREDGPGKWERGIPLPGSPPSEDQSGIEETLIEEEGLHAAGLEAGERPRLKGPGRGRRPASPARLAPFTAGQKLLILDAWQRSALRADDFGALVGVSRHTLYAWKHAFDELGPAALEPQRRGTVSGSRLPELTKRAVLMLKKAHPEWGCERLSDVLWRSAGYAASAGAVARYLKEQGYSAPEPGRSSPHPPVVHRFERARVNQLWQSDLFTFLLKRESRRLYLVVFMDDHSRFLVSWGVHASASGALVREALLAGVANFGAPEEVLTDNGPQYATWRGTSAFTRLLRQRGIKHLLAHPRRPQTLGKVERFWGSLWRECLEGAVFRSLEEARGRIGLYIDHYNFHRPHQGLDGLIPADRYFEAAPEVLRTLRARVAGNAGELARHGVPRKSFYLTGRIGEAGISVHAEGERIVLTTADGRREEVDLGAPGRRAEPAEEQGFPEVVTPVAREVQDEESNGEEDGANALWTDAGGAVAGECGGEAERGSGAGDAGGTADASGGGGQPGDFGVAVLPDGNAGPAGPGEWVGAAAEGPDADHGAAAGGLGDGKTTADAGGVAPAGFVASGPADDRDRPATGAGDDGEAESAEGGSAGSARREGAEDRRGGSR